MKYRQTQLAEDRHFFTLNPAGHSRTLPTALNLALLTPSHAGHTRQPEPGTTT
jgi:hypothetical protein